MLLSPSGEHLARAWAALRSGLAPLRAYGLTRGVKAAALGAVFVGLLLLVLALHDPASSVRRAADEHARSLDARLRVLRKPARGARIASVQALALLGTVALAVQLARPLLLVFALLVAGGPSWYLTAAVARRRRALEGLVHGFALNLANTMRTTGNIGDSIRIASRITGGPLGEEIEVMLAQMSLGGSLEDALEDLARRGNVLALDVLVSALLIGRKTGGDLPRLMETTASSLREIHRLEAFAAKVMADPKRSFLLMAAAPPLGFVGFKQLMPMIVDPFVATSRGQTVLATCVVAYAMCCLVGWKFSRVDL